MRRQITLGHLKINEKGHKYVQDILNTSRLSYGKYTQKFEEEFARLHGCKFGIFMNSGTSALQVALAALKEVHGYQDGDEVLVPATTFIATSNIVLQNNMKPVFVDVDPYTFNIDPFKIEEKITARTRAIIPVHLFGLPAQMSLIMPIAKRYGLQVIEDSCETMFASDMGKRVGSIGDLGCFSTYVAHLIVGGVGGLVTTNDEQLARICRSLMAHGRDSIYLSIDDDDKKGPELNDIIERRYSFERVGYSYRPTEFESAIALSELETWQQNIKTRFKNACRLTDLLAPLANNYLQLPNPSFDFNHVFMMYPVVVRGNMDRGDLLRFLEDRGIETRYLLPLLSQPIYKKLFPGLDDQYPVAKRLANHGFFIGIHQGLTPEDINYVADAFFEYFGVKR